MQRADLPKPDIYTRLSNNEPTLTSLKLYRSSINCDNLAKALEVNNKLTSLDISGCNITYRKLVKILFALIKNKTLTELNLYDSSYANAGNIVLAGALERALNLKILNLSYTNINEDTVRNFAEALSQNNKLKILNLSDNYIGDKGAEMIASALKNNTTLLELDLSGNKIANKGANHIANALKENNTLRKFKFVASYPIRCLFDEKNIKVFIDALEMNQTLKSLNIANHKLNNEALKYIFEILMTNKTLTKLNLSYYNGFGLKKGDISDDGANYLASFLEENQSLKKINLSCHNISNVGGNAIVKALEKNTTLTSLNLSQNNLVMDLKSLEILVDTIQNNKSIKYLTLGHYYNNRNSRHYFRLLTALEQNNKLKEFDFCTPSGNLNKKAEKECEFLILKKDEKLKKNRITIQFNLLIEKYFYLLKTPLNKDICQMIALLMFSRFDEEKKEAIIDKIQLINSAFSCIQYLLFTDNNTLLLRNKIYHVFQTLKKDESCDKNLEILNTKIARMNYSNKNFFFKTPSFHSDMIIFLDAIKFNDIRKLNILRDEKIKNLHSDADICLFLIKKIEGYQFINEYETLPGTNKEVSVTAFKVYMKTIEIYNCKSASNRSDMLNSISELLRDDKENSVIHQELYGLVDAYINKEKRLMLSDSEVDSPPTKRLRLG